MKKIPVDTKWFKYYNCNPKNKVGDDCVVRAISTYLETSWKDTVLDMTETGLKYGYVLNDPHCINKYLSNKGLVKQKEPRDRFNKKMTVKKWLDKNPHISCIANVGSHHVVAIENGKVLDIWDSSNSTMHSYWTLI